MGTIGIILIALLVFVGIFLLLREVNCWYWKINERISLLNEQNDLLKKLVSGGLKEKAEIKRNFERENDSLIDKSAEKHSDDDIVNEGNIITEAIDKVVQNNMAAVPAEILDKLSPAKKYKLERLIDEMGNSDIIVYHDNTIKLLDKERWDGIVSSGVSDKYEIVFKKGSPE
jgi:hypothetical protein